MQRQIQPRQVNLELQRGENAWKPRSVQIDEEKVCSDFYHLNLKYTCEMSLASKSVSIQSTDFLPDIVALGEEVAGHAQQALVRELSKNGRADLFLRLQLPL